MDFRLAGHPTPLLSIPFLFLSHLNVAYWVLLLSFGISLCFFVFSNSRLSILLPILLQFRFFPSHSASSLSASQEIYAA